eukprot:824296-Prymnesium_polylepis.2
MRNLPVVPGEACEALSIRLVGARDEVGARAPREDDCAGQRALPATAEKHAVAVVEERRLHQAIPALQLHDRQKPGQLQNRIVVRRVGVLLDSSDPVHDALSLEGPHELLEVRRR